MKKPLSYKNDWLYQLKVALTSSWISILIILIVLWLASLQQSDTIVIALLDKNPGNFILFVILVLSLAQIVAHYPIYLEVNQIKSPSNTIKWNIEPVIWGFGLITFPHGPFKKSRIIKSKPIQLVRNMWGLFLLVAVFYLLLIVHTRNIELFECESYVSIWKWLQVLLFTFFCVGSYVAMQNYFSRKSEKIIKLFIKTTSVVFLLIFSIAVIFTTLAGWSKVTYWWMYTLIYASSPFYSAIRLFRNYTFLRKHNTFLKLIAFSGLLSISILIIAHIFVFSFNPLVILLAQLNVIYGLVIVPMKHYFFYRQPLEANKINLTKRIVFLWLFRLYLPLFFILSIIAGFIGNDLHKLPTVEENPQEVVSFGRFINDFETTFAQKDTIYFIASFGGGLKANIWNQLIFERLSNYGGRNILASTVAISGVSGGAIGHAVFGGFYQKYGPYVRGDTTLRENIRNLGKKNFVSLDLTYLLGLDLLREFLPNFLAPNLEFTNDRAKQAMQEYSDFVNNGNNMLDLSYRAYWARLYRQEQKAGRFFPAFIGNAAGTHIQRGIACSVEMEDKEFKNTFFDSTDLLSFADSRGKKLPRSLPYLYAASCTNRFPLFSPAAKIEHKGHFIDGGYFENSGMLSLLDFYEKLKKESELFRSGGNPPKVVFIQIINDREEYLKSLIVNPYKKRIKEASELSSIFGTVSSVSFVPSYLMTKNALVEQAHSHAKTTKDSARIHYAQIHLPYYVTKRDIEKVLKLKEIKLDKATEDKITESNDRIRRIMQCNLYDYVQPPLARLLGKQAVAYMDSALNQRETWEDLNRILGIPPNSSR